MQNIDVPMILNELVDAFKRAIISIHFLIKGSFTLEFLLDKNVNVFIRQTKVT